MTRVSWLILVKVMLALLGFSALVTEVATLLERDRLVWTNFASYFTVESNALAVISLLIGAFAAAAGRQSPRMDYMRGAVSLYMTTTLIIYIALLSGYSSDELTAVAWDNTVLHYIMPIAVIVDWLVTSRVRPVPVAAALVWLVFPLGYLAYSLVRGPIVDWYPYPFMDPGEHGYAGVAITSVIIAAVIAALAVLLAAAPRWTSALVIDRR